MNPKVTLVSWTKDPIETLYTIWEASKSNRDLGEIVTNSEDKLEIFKKIVDSKIPVAENIDFVFILENVSISFREQMVRHRIGVKVGDRIGADIVPDLADSVWWSQSMRILDMGQFANEGRYRVPPEVEEHKDPLVAHQYKRAMDFAQMAYNKLIEAGVPMEEAREVIPLGATHRISWKLNLSALQHIIGKRSCWILQAGLWEPIIRGMVEELSKKVHPYFHTLIDPPCIKGNKFVGCLFKLDNERRLDGTDDLPPCSLYMAKEAPHLAVPAKQNDEYHKMARKYEKLWGRDPWSGEKADALFESDK